MRKKFNLLMYNLLAARPKQPVTCIRCRGHMADCNCHLDTSRSSYAHLCC